jgi:deoxyribose-phosphate aldolase
MGNKMSNLKEEIGKIVSLIDLTSLNEDDTPEIINKLCKQSNSPLGTTAAVCVYPRFIPYARKFLQGLNISQVKIATVTNFPHGNDDLEVAFSETRAAVGYGADEIDVVLPYKALIAGNEKVARNLVRGCSAICGERTVLKVIIESGELKSPELIKKASVLSIEEGANFIKTSTGKVNVSATPEAAKIMLETIREIGNGANKISFKPAGGVKTLEDARIYIQLAEDILGKDWITPQTLRFGASSLLPNLLASAGIGSQGSTSGY